VSDGELKTCPLCGAKLHLSATEAGSAWGVECCGCDGILIFRPTREEAVAAANRRADEARIRAEAAAERTRAILDIIRSHDLRDCSPGYIANTIEMAFPSPGGRDGG
jgi:hypothetical protein